MGMLEFSWWFYLRQATGAAGFYQHLVSINADKYTATDADSIPTGMLKNVGGTLWDLRIPRLVGDVIAFVPFGGYDQNLCIPRSQSECKTFVARCVLYYSYSITAIMVYVQAQLAILCILKLKECYRSNTICEDYRSAQKSIGLETTDKRFWLVCGF